MRTNTMHKSVEECAAGVLSTRAHVQERYMIKLPLGKQAALLGDNGDVKYLECDE